MYQLNMRQYEEREEDLVKENDVLRQYLYDLHHTMLAIVEDTLHQQEIADFDFAKANV